MASSADCGVGFGKFLAFLAVLTFLIHAASLANPYWLNKEIGVPNPQNPTQILGEVDSSIGLFWACTDSDLGILKIYECKSLPDTDADSVEDWQWIAAGFGVGALLTNVIGLILSFAIICSKGPAKRTRAGAIFCYIFSCILFVVTLILFNENKDFTRKAGALSMTIEYDFDWGFYVSCVADCMFFIMAILHMFTACRMRNANTIV